MSHLIIHFFLRNRKTTLCALVVISLIVSYLGGKDAIISSKQYNSIVLNNPLSLQILAKYNKKPDGVPFPDLNLKGIIIQTSDTVEIKASLGDYEKRQVGERINVYKVGLTNQYMTQYEVENQIFIHFGGKAYSFVFIPAILFLLLGVFSLFGLVKLIIKNKKSDFGQAKKI
jgi:hypothetical protein